MASREKGSSYPSGPSKLNFSDNHIPQSHHHTTASHFLSNAWAQLIHRYSLKIIGILYALLISSCHCG